MQTTEWCRFLLGVKVKTSEVGASAAMGTGGVQYPVLVRHVSTKLREVFGLDTRSLALFRVMVAVTALWDLADRARDLTAHYTVQITTSAH